MPVRADASTAVERSVARMRKSHASPVVEGVEQGHGDGVRLFAGGAARDKAWMRLAAGLAFALQEAGEKLALPDGQSARLRGRSW